MLDYNQIYRFSYFRLRPLANTKLNSDNRISWRNKHKLLSVTMMRNMVWIIPSNVCMYTKMRLQSQSESRVSQTHRHFQIIHTKICKNYYNKLRPII